MSFPIGSIYAIPVTVNHGYIPGAASHFLYQIDLSNVLTNDPIFKSLILSTNNIAVYDFDLDINCSKYVFLNLSLNDLFVYFDGVINPSADKHFYICVGNGVNELNTINVFTNNGYSAHWSCNESVDGNILYEDIGSYNGLKDSSYITLGYKVLPSPTNHLFGRCAKVIGSTNGPYKIRTTYTIPIGDLTIECLVLINGAPSRYIASCETGGLLLNFRGSYPRNVNFSSDGVNFVYWDNSDIYSAQHIIVARRANQITDLYVNGSLVASGNSGVQSQSEFLTFFNRALGGSYLLYDTLDEFGVMTTVKDQNFVLTRYNQFKYQTNFFTINEGINVTDIHAEFSSNETETFVNIPIQFTDESISGWGIDSWDWDLDDEFISNEQNPSQSWSIPGLKTISLSVTDDYGNDTETKINYINILPLAGVADFIGIPCEGYNPLTVKFRDTSTGGLFSIWLWEFGDGTTSSIQHPTHTYEKPGIYKVGLTVTIAGGPSYSVSREAYIIVYEIQSGDIWFGCDLDTGAGDISVRYADLKRDPGFETAVYISLFTDRRAFDSDLLPANNNDKRGWWADNSLGSRLWLLEREVVKNEIVARAREYCQEALQWMISDGIASKIEVTCLTSKNSPELQITISIYQRTKGPLSFVYYFNWKEQTTRRE